MLRVTTIRLLALLTSVAAGAAPVSTGLACLDADAEPVSASVAGAILAVDLAAPPSAAPPVLASAAAGPWNQVSGLARVSAGGFVVSDLGPLAGAAQDGRLFTVAAGGAVQLLSADARLREPAGIAEWSPGTLAIADSAADPSALGLDAAGADGHGAVFAHDALGLRVVADGTRHAIAGVAAGTSVFEDPIAVARDVVTGGLLVLDFNAALPGSFGWGALFLVDAAGTVTVLSADDDFYDLAGVATLSDGTILVLDGTRGDSRLYRIDRGADVTGNAIVLSQGAQHARLEGVSVGPLDEIFVVDSGEYDAVAGAFVREPALKRIEPLLPLRQNGVAVHDGTSLLLPVEVAVETADVTEGLAESIAIPVGAGADGIARALDATCSLAPWDLCPARIAAGALGTAALPLVRSPVPSLRLVTHSAPTSSMRLVREGERIVAH